MRRAEDSSSLRTLNIGKNKIKSLLKHSPLHPPPRRQVGPKKQLAAFNLGTYVNEVGN